MARFTNDNVELDPDALSDAEKAQLKRLDEVVRRIDALQRELAILEEARIALSKGLQQGR
jgi:hypothetical protein